MNAQEFIQAPRKTCDQMNFCEMPPARLPALSVVNERFAREVQMMLSNLMREVASVSVKSVASLPFSDFLKTQESSAFYSIASLEKLEGPTLFAVDRKLHDSMVDVLFGGKPRASVAASKREPSRTEVMVSQEIFKVVIEEFNRAWAPVHEVGAVHLRSEVKSQFVAIVPPQENVLLTSFEIEFAGISGVLAIVIPYLTLFPARDRLIWK